MEKATRRGNYESGSDYVLEYGELRFSFNEDDFGQRVEQAAVKLEFVDQGLAAEELHDLVELAVNGEIREPASELGEHVNEHWTELVGPANRSLVHWIRRLVFRGAWLDQRVKEGELDVVFDERDAHFRIHPARARRRADRAVARALLGRRGVRPLSYRSASSSAFAASPSIRSRSSAAASCGVEAGELGAQRARPPRAPPGSRSVFLARDAAVFGDAAPGRPPPRRARDRGG